MVQYVEVFAAEPEGLIPRAHMVKGENHFPGVSI